MDGDLLGRVIGCMHHVAHNEVHVLAGECDPNLCISTRAPGRGAQSRWLGGRHRTHADGPIGADLFERVAPAGKTVLVRTGWSARWGRDGYFRSGPFLIAAACAWLIQRGPPALVGIDCANIDNISDTTRPAHTLLLGASVPIVEHLTGLDSLPPHGFRFFAVPPAIARGTTFTVRAFALID